ncbi:MAG: alpha-amylase family glycosyl hydrolase, partial [Rhodothermales bacterium]|nr:alpha-amylase family glycosyl hydrolase [Rhodothermales bacterium]
MAPSEPEMLAQVQAHLADAFARHPAFEARLHAYFADFWHSYRAVYPEATAPHVRALFELLIDALDARDPRLAALDQARAADPAWFQRPEMVGMMCYVDRFAGDLPGVRARIPYLQELGVTYLHLMPLLRSREGPNDGGYAVADYRRVDPRLGTMDDLRALAARLHDAGIHLVVDFVMNHTAREHAWAEAARAGDAVHQAFYFTFPDRRLPDAYERTLPEVFPDFA